MLYDYFTPVGVNLMIFLYILGCVAAFPHAWSYWKTRRLVRKECCDYTSFHPWDEVGFILLVILSWISVVVCVGSRCGTR